MKYGFGVDIGNKDIRMAYFDEEGNLLQKWTIEAKVSYNGSELLPSIADEIERYMKENNISEDDILGIGVGIPGPVNANGTVNRCVNFGWGVFNIDRALSGLTFLNVTSGNRANMAAIGEAWRGSGKGHKNVFFAAMNTGLGGAVISNGNMVYGSHGGAGEIGHITVNRQETEVCTCGKKGCLEQYCSPFGIARVAGRYLEKYPDASVLREKKYLSYEDVIQAAMAGDELAGLIMDKVCMYLGETLANVSCITNPNTIILGGLFTKYEKCFMHRISYYFKKYAFHANADVHFLSADLGSDAVLYGAFKMAHDKFYEGELA